MLCPHVQCSGSSNISIKLGACKNIKHVNYNDAWVYNVITACDMLLIGIKLSLVSIIIIVLHCLIDKHFAEALNYITSVTVVHYKHTNILIRAPYFA